ncbi:alkaline phosphatase family protein [Variovorax gracilis]|uniref:alkaline phosphatase family protein n=1 Tax=Variovorax gracilis TaxID=3053502 RepID=UPI0025760CA7|nr:alkaline phosphatase family protein [Variovorax sp. J22R24]
MSEGRAGPGTSITAVSIAGGRIALFLADPDGGVFTASGNAEQGWSPWSSVSEGRAGPKTSITAVPFAGNRIALFLADVRGGVFAASGNAETGWSPWLSVSEGHAGPNTSIAAVPIAGNRFALFVADPGGGVFSSLGDFGSPIKHVFVLMLENRSFDHMLGFSGITGTDALTGKPTTIDGLKGDESNEFTDSAGTVHTHTVAAGAPDQISIGPAHEFVDVLEQLTGRAVDPAFNLKGSAYPTPITNGGFVANYQKRVAAQFAKRRRDALSASGLNSALTIDALNAQEASFDLGVVMKCFGPGRLPVLSALAKEFVVCDHWFSSMPGPTEPNRMFAHAATCGTWDRSPDQTEILVAQGSDSLHPGFTFKHGTVYDLLKKAGVQYRIYAGDLFPVVGEFDNVDEQRDFEDFADDLQDPSALEVGYFHIEPSYGIVPFSEPLSQHPSFGGGVAAGERFIKAAYEAIRKSPLWATSLLIITWDEHGGFYDHVKPSPAIPTGNLGRSHGFTFDQLGARVPAVIVSPLIRGNLIEHRVLDHTAIPATLSRVFQLPSLGARDGINGGVDQLVGGVFRSETPSTLPDAASTGLLAAGAITPVDKAIAHNPAALIFDDPHGNLTAVLHSAVVRHLKVALAGEHAAIVERVRLLRTHAEAFTYLKEVEQLVRANRVQPGVSQRVGVLAPGVTA